MVRARVASRWRKALFCAGLAGSLTACSHTPAWVPWHKNEPQQAQVPPQAAPSEPPHEEPRRRKPAHAAGPRKPEEEQQVAMVDPNAIVGLKPHAVARLLGTPSATTKDEMSLVWTYSADGCVMKVYFYPDLKTADFHVLKFTLLDADQKPLSEDAPCRHKLLAQRENDTG